MSKYFIAVGPNVFVKEIQKEEKVGELFIPESLDTDFTYGEVISCDGGYTDHGNFVPMPCNIGDVIAFPKVSGTKVTFNGMKLIRVFAGDIVAKEIEGEFDPDGLKV